MRTRVLSILSTVVIIFATIISASAQQAPPESPRDLNERLLEMARETGPASARGMLDYKIGPEDLLEVSVFEVPELSRTVRVSASGEISLPLVGSLKVA